jgi:hypothetical protein
MAGFTSLRDLLFPAAKPLAAAANAGGPAPNTPQPATSTGIDVAAEAQKSANRQLAKPATPAPTVAPVKKKKPGVAATVGSQLMEQ